MISRRPGGRRKIINDFPPAGRPAEKIQFFPKLILLQQQQQQPANRPAFLILLLSPRPALRSLKSPFPLFFSIFSFVSDSACIFCWETCFLTLLHASPLFVSDQLYVKYDGEVNRFPISFLFGLFPHPIGLAKRNLQNHFYGKHQN